MTALILAEKNANLIFGSDTPSMMSYANPPGLNGYLEILAWYNANVSLDQIFKSLTIDNAKAFHLDHLYGTIEKGKIANLLILSSNPMDSVNAYNKIEKIIIRGKVLSRKELAAQ